jgi:glutathione peroxidase
MRLLAISTVMIGFALNAWAAPPQKSPSPAGTVYAFTMKDIDGREVKLSKYRGKVLLIVNVASRCGNTPQYAGLQNIYEKYRKQGLVVLGFPANDFGAQEPGTEAEIKQFCTANYKVTFPMFSKITVKGEGQAPLYRFLTSKETNPEFGGEIEWNFAKFLIGRDGKPVGRFSARTQPEDPKVIEAIEKALKGQK